MVLSLEIIAAVIALLALGIVIGRRSIALAARARAERVPVRLTCPKRGCLADCTLVHDPERGEYLGVERCSVFGPDVAPRCRETCVALLNDGLPISAHAHDDDLRGPVTSDPPLELDE